MFDKQKALINWAEDTFGKTEEEFVTNVFKTAFERSTGKPGITLNFTDSVVVLKNDIISVTAGSKELGIRTVILRENGGKFNICPFLVTPQ